MGEHTTILDAAIAADRAWVLAAFSVSRETAERLDRFVEVLLRWQRHTNLIAPSTVPTLWSRHVADSLQLLDLVALTRPSFAGPPSPAGPGGIAEQRTRETGAREPCARENYPSTWVDLGSGGGFPGLVIACALAEVDGATVRLIESNTKKAAFLREAARMTGAPAIIHHGRIEEIGPALRCPADVITARALAPLEKLCALIAPMLKTGAEALLPKGQDLEVQLTQATKYWNIDYEIAPSRTDPAGRIVVVRALSRRNLPEADHG